MAEGWDLFREFELYAAAVAAEERRRDTQRKAEARRQGRGRGHR